MTDMCTKLFMRNTDENAHLKNLEDKKNGLRFKLHSSLNLYYGSLMKNEIKPKREH